MQAQGQRQQVAISPQQSLAVVKTLLSASFGCIAYLRNLLPEDNFGEGRLTAGERGSLSYGPSASRDGQSGKASGITIKTVTRGFSTEADKLLNYLEFGIFDAIERQYLKSFIFAIYLDSEDPNNIIEAYTYNLTYYTIPGSGTTVPIMTLDDQLSSLSLGGKPCVSDPVALSTLRGKPPTLGDVKQSVKALVKNLILATQALEPLPKRRFAGFKLFYTDDTPADYEPPHFRPGDPYKDRYIFTTHNKSEIPEKISVGSVVTPHHGVDLHVQSVAKYIPNGEENDCQFGGFVSVQGNGRSGPVGTSDPSVRSKQIAAQRKDAEERVVAWSAEDSRMIEEDADGEDDPEFVNDSGIGLEGPLGVRKPDGSIVPITGKQCEEAEDDMEVDAAEGGNQFFGKPELVPSNIRKLRERKSNGSVLDPTQQLDDTQIIQASIPVHETSSENTAPQGTKIDASIVSRGVDTQLIKRMVEQNSALEWSADDEMLDMETQPMLIMAPRHPQTVAKEPDSTKADTQAGFTEEQIHMADNAQCACELPDGDDLVLCDGPCNKWFHLWCMGYHSPEDPRLPDSYVCIPCRLQADANFHLIKDAYPDILRASMDLALFRRAIKLAEVHNPGGLKDFRKVTGVGCTATLAEQLWKRLEREGFVVLEVTQSDQVGLLETRTRAQGKATKATKRVKSTKHVQRYVFNMEMKNSKVYKDYFSPDSEAEKELLGLKNKGRKSKSKKSKSKDTEITAPEPTTIRDARSAEMSPGDNGIILAAQESQTQDETQLITTATSGPGSSQLPSSDIGKRTSRDGSGSSQDTVRANKKVKISIGEGIDIEE